MKRIFIIFSLTILFFSSFSIYRTDKASAVGEGAIYKIAVGSAGDRVIFGIGEKMGIKITSKATRSKAVQKWNARTAEKLWELQDQKRFAEYDRLYDLQKQLATLEEKSVVPKVDGVGTALLSGALFLTGATIFTDIYDEMKRSAEFGDLVDGLKDSTEPDPFAAGNVVGYGNLKLFTTYDEYEGTKYWFGNVNEIGNGTVSLTAENYHKFRITYMDVDKTFVTFWTNIWQGGTGFYKIQAGDNPGLGTVVTFTPEELPSSFPTEIPWLPGKSIVINPGDPDNPDYDPTNPDSDDYPFIIPKDVPIDIPVLPETDTGGGVKPIEVFPVVNDPIPAFPWKPGKNPDGDSPGNPDTGTNPSPTPIGGIDPVPIPGGVKPPVIPEKPPKEPDDPDKPPGGTTPPGGQDGTFWMLLAFIDLLRAILWYIMRFVTFIVTIPAIPSLPFDNAAFHWVRTSKFLGIYPYNLVMNLATLGLSLSVYKIVRRFI